LYFDGVQAALLETNAADTQAMIFGGPRKRQILAFGVENDQALARPGLLT